MRYTNEISNDGPYLRVLLPDVLPPDWEALRRELQPEVDEGATRVMLVIGECAGFTPEDPGLTRLVDSLRSQGLDTVVLLPDGSELTQV